jgi:hypothetical protein
MLRLQVKMFEAAITLLEKKSADYAEEDDPFANLRLCERIGICSAQTGIQVRMADKFQRIVNLTKGFGREAVVKDESVIDSGLDLMNYVVLQMAEAIDKGTLKWQAESQDQSLKSAPT